MSDAESEFDSRQGQEKLLYHRPKTWGPHRFLSGKNGDNAAGAWSWSLIDI
jgi:hypothetical protein